MRNSYDDDDLLQGDNNQPRQQQPTPEEQSLQRSMIILKELQRIDNEIQKMSSSQTQQLQKLLELQVRLSAQEKALEAVAKKQHDVYADIVKINDEALSKFSSEYTLSDTNKEKINKVLVGLVDNVVNEVGKKMPGKIARKVSANDTSNVIENWIWRVVFFIILISFVLVRLFVKFKEIGFLKTTEGFFFAVICIISFFFLLIGCYKWGKKNGNSY